MALGIYLIPGIIIVLWKLYRYFTSSKNPFAYDTRCSIKPLVTNQKERDAVLKQSFKVTKVPENLDAIIIGSGIGGLSTAAILTKAGKKVLVLEQHDQAGGCCHTYLEKGYEFDVGIHYIGDMGHQSITKTYLDQISDGQIQWEPLNEAFDTVVFRAKDKSAWRYFPVYNNLEKQKDSLKKQFPGEENAIDRFYELVAEAYHTFRHSFILKFLPFWLSKLLIQLNVVQKILRFYKLNEKTLKEVVDELTPNQTLRDIFCYCFGDYGSLPSQCGFPMQALLINHYQRGASYPVGGASEIAFNIIPTIERGGGKVLVRAEVSEILVNSNGVVEGVKVQHGTQESKIFAPLVISSAGLYNTFLKFLPHDIAKESRLFPLMKKKRALAGISVFVGLDATPEELDIPGKKNYWVFSGNDIDKITADYLKTPKDEYENADIPVVFLSFPSTKDSTWESRYPGKTTMTIVTFSNYEWYEEWEKEPCKRRSDEYERLKKTIGWKIIDQAIDMFPKIKDRIDYVSVGTPLSNNFYIGSTRGEIYGLDHDQDRFRPLNCASLRPTTDIPGLYLSGQDVATCGFVGAIFGGLLCAQQILGRNVLNDLTKLKKQIKKIQSAKEE